MTGRRTGTEIGARTIAGVVAAVAVVAAVGLAIVTPWPTHRSEPVSIVAEPVPADIVIACDGPLLAAGRLAEQASAVSVAAGATVVSGTSAAVPPEQLILAMPDVTASEGVPALLSPVDGREVAPVAAATSSSVSAADLRGLAADGCRPALFDSWLAGGAATTGSADLLLIANPGEVSATVSVTVYGTEGAVVPPGGESVIVPPRTQRVLPLSGLALGQAAPVIRIAAEGAPVRASLQSSLVRTLVPLGVDQQSAVASASHVQVIPSVAVTTAPGEAGASDATTILRVLAPVADTTARVRVVPLSGSAAVTETSAPLTAGVPVEVELGGLPIGSYAVVVEADADLVTSVWQSAGSDFAWLTSSPELSGPAPVAVAAGPPASLQVMNPGTAAATVTLTPLSGGGPAQTLEVAPGSLAQLSLPASTTWTLDPGAGSVYAGVTLTAPDALAGYAVWPPDAVTSAITVYP